MLDAALQLADEGYRILPIRPRDKRPPLVKGGCHAATQDSATIERWWTWQPQANIAAATGNDFAVAEFDPRSGGTLEAVAALGIPMETRRVRTPSGGMHFHLAVDAAVKSRSSALAPGVDVKGYGGYVLLPPSARADGAYIWDSAPDAPILSVEAAVLNQVTVGPCGSSQIGINAQNAGSSLVGGRKRAEDVCRGERNSQLCLWAGWWAWTRDDLSEVEDLLWQFNERMPTPLPDDEVASVVEWISHKTLRKLKA